VGTAAAKHREFAVDLTFLAPWPHCRSSSIQGKDYVRRFVDGDMTTCRLMYT
jgi:hypothetical protein